MRSNHKIVFVAVLSIGLLPAGCKHDGLMASASRPGSTPAAAIRPARANTPVGGGSGRITFVSSRDGNMEIFAMDANGRNPVRMTESNARESRPIWSPDGNWLAFTSTQDDPDPENCVKCNRNIFMMNADGSVLLRLTDMPGHEAAYSWSPDGKRIAFISDEGGNLDVYALHIHDFRITQLTDTPYSEFLPAWSPDGSRIAFVAEKDEKLGLYIMNADGSGTVKLPELSRLDVFPAWSPDGTKIAFCSIRGGRADIYIMNADGTDIVRLTDNQKDDGYLSFSPDGTKLLFASGQGENAEIFIMNVDGSGVLRLTDNAYGDYDPVWRPSSTTVPSSTAPNSGRGRTHADTQTPIRQLPLLFMSGAG